MRSYKRPLVFFFSLLLIVITAFATLKGQSQNSSGGSHQEKLNSPAKVKTKEIESPITEKQKSHSKLLKQSQGRKLRELAAVGTGDIVVSVEEPFVISTAGEESPPSVQTKVCNAHAVVIGMLNDSSPQLTEDESFLFTEYTMSVEEVIKDNPAAAIQPGNSITVIREGGTGRLHGRVVRARVEGFKTFDVGKRYLFFLRFVPDTNSYLAFPNGSFELNENEVVPLGKASPNELRDATTFLTAARTTVAGGCN